MGGIITTLVDELLVPIASASPLLVTSGLAFLLFVALWTRVGIAPADHGSLT